MVVKLANIFRISFGKQKTGKISERKLPRNIHTVSGYCITMRMWAFG